MATKQEVWRKVDGKAIRCTDCRYNRRHVLDEEDGTIVGVGYVCTVKDGLCDFLHKAPEGDKWYPDAKSVYEDEEKMEDEE